MSSLSVFFIGTNRYGAGPRHQLSIV